MKQILASCTVLFVLLSFSLFCGKALNDLSDNCIQQLAQAQQSADTGQWNQSLAITQQVFHTWTSHNFYLYALLHHEEADQILLSFRSVEEYLKLEEMDEYAAANAILMTQLRLAAEVERPSWTNVL